MAIIFLKGHFLFKDNKLKNTNILKIWQFAIEFNEFSKNFYL